MPILDLFSRRERRKAQMGPDVYVYDKFPQELRVQIVHIWTDVIGIPTGNHYQPNRADGSYQLIHDALARERGVFKLHSSQISHFDGLQKLLLSGDVETCLDIVELSFRMIDNVLRAELEQQPYHFQEIGALDNAISELNGRFKESRVGYRYEQGEIVQVDSEYIHSEVVKPTLALLQDKRFTGASQEFLKAHEHYRHGRNKEAVVEALKAFESTIKIICAQRNWNYSANAAASGLIDVIFQEQLLPTYLTSQFTGLRTVLETGVPTVRNKTSGHGQGVAPLAVPDYLAAFVLHSAAANIQLLVEAHKAKK